MRPGVCAEADPDQRVVVVMFERGEDTDDKRVSISVGGAETSGPGDRDLTWPRVRAGGGEVGLRPLLSSAPRRDIGPAFQRLYCEIRRLGEMASSARIRHLQLFRSRRRDEFERMGTDIDVGKRLLDFRHVAAYALISGAARFVVGMGLNGGRAGTVGRVRAVALKAQDVGGLQEIRIVFRAVHVMAAEAAHAMGVHQTGNEIIALHPVLMGRAIREVGKRLLAEFMLFQLPEILKGFSGLEANRPIVILSGDGVLERLALRMTLDTDVIGMDKVKARRVHDILP